MASTTDSSASQQPINALERIWTIPLIQENVLRIHKLLESSYVAGLYARGESLACSLYSHAKPSIDKLPLSTANSYVNASLDFVQSKYPSVFEVHTETIVKNARRPADAAIELFQTRLHVAQQSVAGAQDRLATAVAKLPSVPKSQEEVSRAVEDLVQELHKVKDSVATNVKGLPSNVEQVISPLGEHLSTGIHDINVEFGRKDVPLSNRVSNILTYSRENATPVIQEALNKLKSFVVKKKDEVVANGAPTVNGIKDAVTPSS